MTQDIQEVVLWCLIIALLTTVVFLLRQRHITATVRKRNRALADGLRARDEEVQHLASVRLPALEESLHQPVPATGLIDPRLTETAFAHSLDVVVDRFSGAVERAQARADKSAKAALKTSMRSIQALANEQQLSISDMQNRHDDPHVLQDLLEIDHANSQFGRRAQAIAVLCGSWPGRQRAASSLTDAVRGATSRIRDYRRVQIQGQVDIAIESRAVEPVVLAVAELLDNAARHSQPNTTVEVNLQTVHNGACIVIDDAGIGMDGQVAQRAATVLSGEQNVDVTRLDDPPQFGFAVIGVLAARYGFTVSTDTRSPYGGVRAVLFLPSSILTHIEPETPDGSFPSAPEQARPVPTPAHDRAGALPQRTAPAVPAGAGDRPSSSGASRAGGPAVPAGSGRTEHSGEAVNSPDAGQPRETTVGGLPKRRRHAPRQQPAGDVPQQPGRGSGADSAAEVPGARSAQETAMRMGAFARGTRFGRDARDDEGMTPE